MDLWVVVGVVIVAVAVGAGQAGGDKSATPLAGTTRTTEAPEAAVAKTWTTVATLSGDADEVGDPFELTGNKIRITYTITNPNVMPMLNVYLMEEGKYLDSDGGFPEVMTAETSGDTTAMKAAGSYYLDVSGANCDWKVTVEEQR